MWTDKVTHSSRIRMTSALFSKTSWRVMMFECWISFRMFTSRSMSSLDTPRRLDLLRLFLMNLAAYSTPVLLCRHLLTTANCPLEKGWRRDCWGCVSEKIMTLLDVHVFLEITFYSMDLADCSKMQICIHCHLCTCSLDYPVMIKIYSHFEVARQLLWKFRHQVARQHCYSMLLMTPLLPLHQNTDKKENNANNNSRLAENVANASMVFASSKPWQSWDTINQTPTEERRAHGGAGDRKKSDRVTHFVSFCFRICTIRFQIDRD